jgi:hypothetical protein
MLNVIPTPTLSEEQVNLPKLDHKAKDSPTNHNEPLKSALSRSGDWNETKYEPSVKDYPTKSCAEWNKNEQQPNASTSLPPFGGWGRKTYKKWNTLSHY